MSFILIYGEVALHYISMWCETGKKGIIKGIYFPLDDPAVLLISKVSSIITTSI